MLLHYNLLTPATPFVCVLPSREYFLTERDADYLLRAVILVQVLIIHLLVHSMQLYPVIIINTTINTNTLLGWMQKKPATVYAEQNKSGTFMLCVLDTCLTLVYFVV